MDQQQFEEIMQKCAELGKLIGKTSVYQEFKKAEYNLLNNPQARKLVEDLQKMKQSHYLKKMSGTGITKDDEEKMKEFENTCLTNSQVFNSNNANNNFQELMERISGKIREGIKSGEE
ncbi:YlbF family regulator [Desulfosporosinus sp. SB140]|uniref:YlbF family regulator n=1 Tax=Desulfosporosinus paludis TaxID=3115649 RepID=UPI00388D300B